MAADHGSQRDGYGGEGTISYPEVELTRNALTGKYDGTLTGLGVAGIYKLSILARGVNKEV